jgi:competence protein ComEA
LVGLRATGQPGAGSHRRTERPPGDEPLAESTVPLPVLADLERGVREVARRWVPERLRGARLDPERPGAVALVVVLALAALVAAASVWWSRPVPVSAPTPVSVRPSAGDHAEAEQAGPASAGPPPGAGLVVSVAGKVRHPGLVRVPAGARVAEAVERAGGPLPGADLTSVNLARRLTDGEQVLVGLPPPAGQVDPAGPVGVAASGGRVDLNTATLQELDSLPGVGQVTAQRILDWRSRHGRFTSVEQLREIQGIGERRFGQLRDAVTV